MRVSGPIIFIGRETFWVRRHGDVWRHSSRSCNACGEAIRPRIEIGRFFDSLSALQ